MSTSLLLPNGAPPSSASSAADSSSASLMITAEVAQVNPSPPPMQQQQVVMSREGGCYEQIDQIGKGAYGTVYRARDTATGAIVALKKMRFLLTEDGVPMAILREIALLKQLQRFNHPNIVRLLAIAHGQGGAGRDRREMSLHLIFEHMQQDLAAFIEKCPAPGLGADLIRDLSYQIVRGVDFLHSHRIVHRDLKPQNVLVAADGTVKLTDFGLARIYDFYTLLTSVVVTLWYRSPEVLLGVSYATPVDMWAVGCILAELFLRKPLLAGNSEMDQLSLILSLVGTPAEEAWPANAAVSRNNFVGGREQAADLRDVLPEADEHALDLLQSLLTFSPDHRISASRALAHPYFDAVVNASSGGDHNDGDVVFVSGHNA